MVQESTAPSTAETNESRTILYWRAPMNPLETYDNPGKSAMGMDLVPVYADDNDSTPARQVSIDPVTVQNMGVRTTLVERRDLSRIVRAAGTIEYNEESQHVVSTKVAGWIEALHVAYAGESVAKGDTLLEIYAPELVTAQEEYLLALAHHRASEESRFASMRNDAQELLTSTRQRLEYWDVPAEDIDRLATTGQVRKTAVMRAQASGVIQEIGAVLGAYVPAGMSLYQVADLSTVWVHASIREDELPWVFRGQAAIMELAYVPGRRFAGHVSYIYPYLREEARDVLVRLVFDNPGWQLKPGMYVNVHLEALARTDALVVPGDAVIRTGERTIVFVAVAPGRYEPREIQVGETGGERGRFTHVVEGLRAGESVVTSAQFMLDSDSRLQESLRQMRPVSNEPEAADTALAAPQMHHDHH